MTSVLPMTDGPLANVLGHACAISVRSAIVPGHVGPFRVLCLGSRTVVQLALSGQLLVACRFLTAGVSADVRLGHTRDE